MFSEELSKLHLPGKINTEDASHHLHLLCISVSQGMAGNPSSSMFHQTVISFSSQLKNPFEFTIPLQSNQA